MRSILSAVILVESSRTGCVMREEGRQYWLYLALFKSYAVLLDSYNCNTIFSQVQNVTGSLVCLWF